MSDRKNYFYRQKVTEAELDGGFADLEQADWNITVDNKIIGVVDGMVVTEKAGTPDLSVDISGGTTYSKSGERIYFASTQNVDVSQDDGGTPTTVTTPGNTRVVSVFAVFDRALSDPRIDGNGFTVYFESDESFDFSVVQGAEAVIGTEVPPPIPSNKILLADIRLENGTTQVLNAATVGAFDQIEDARREDAFKYTGGTVEIVEGNSYDAIDELLTAFNNHIDAAANQHPAAEVTYTDTQTWLDGTTLDGATAVDDVQEAIEAILTDLAKQASGDDGALKIGKYQSGNWHDGTNLTTGSISSQINKIVADLSSASGNGGCDKIGSVGQNVGLQKITDGSLYDQLGQIVAELNEIASSTALIRSLNFERISSVFGANEIVHDVCFGTTTLFYFVFVGEDTVGSAGVIYTCENPRGTFTTRSPGGIPESLNGVIWSGNLSLFIAVGDSGINGAAIETSSNASTWTARTPTGMTTSGDILRSICYDVTNAYAIAVGDRGGTNGNILRSSDGITWAAATSVPTMQYIYAVAENGSGTVLAVGRSATQATVLRSTNGGNNWSSVLASGTGYFYAVVYDPKSTRWFVAGTDGHFRSNPGDPTIWTSVSFGSTFSSVAAYSITTDNHGGVVFYGTAGSSAYIAMTYDAGDTFYTKVYADSTGVPSLTSPDHARFAGGYNFFFDDADPDIFASLISYGFYKENPTFS